MRNGCINILVTANEEMLVPLVQIAPTEANRGNDSKSANMCLHEKHLAVVTVTVKQTRAKFVGLLCVSGKLDNLGLTSSDCMLHKPKSIMGT